MGMYAAHCMLGRTADPGTGFAFELFTHATRFMGQKVVLLGLYNGQRLEKEPESNVVMYSRADEVGICDIVITMPALRSRNNATVQYKLASGPSYTCKHAVKYASAACKLLLPQQSLTYAIM